MALGVLPFPQLLLMSQPGVAVVLLLRLRGCMLTEPALA
jgi:hypothetical protein